MIMRLLLFLVTVQSIFSNSAYSPTFGRPYMTQPSVEDTQNDQDVERIIASIVPRMKDFHKLLSRRPQVQYEKK